MKKATTTTPDPELSTPLGPETDVNGNAPRRPQAGREQVREAAGAGDGTKANKTRQQAGGDVCGVDGACI